MKQLLSSLLLLICVSPSLLLAEQRLTPEQAREVYRIPVPIAQGPFSADWKSFTADKLKQEPDWWRDAKIGIWFHWGPQSMGRNGDWYARFLYQQPPQGRRGRANERFMYDVHLERFGHPSEFGYMDVLNAWKAPKFDPKKLMALYVEYCQKWFNRLKEFVDDYDPDFLYTDGTEPFTGQGTAKGVISDACVKVVAHMYNKRYAKNNGSVDCMAVIKGGPSIPG